MSAILGSVENLGKMLVSGRPVRARCEQCGAIKEFTTEDIEALAAKVGYRYSLIDRRCKCRLTPGCDGWNRFEYRQNVWWSMATETGRLNEMRREARQRERLREFIADYQSRSKR